MKTILIFSKTILNAWFQINNTCLFFLSMLSKKINNDHKGTLSYFKQKKKKKSRNIFNLRIFLYKYLAVILVSFSAPDIFNKRSGMWNMYFFVSCLYFFLTEKKNVCFVKQTRKKTFKGQITAFALTVFVKYQPVLFWFENYRKDIYTKKIHLVNTLTTL